jgi:hypothetical protein
MEGTQIGFIAQEVEEVLSNKRANRRKCSLKRKN